MIVYGHADHSDESLNMASLSGRSDPLLRAMVSPLSVSLRSCGRIDEGARASRRGELWSGDGSGPTALNWISVAALTSSRPRGATASMRPTSGSRERTSSSTGRLINTARRSTSYSPPGATPRPPSASSVRHSSGPVNPHPRVINVDRNPGLPGRGRSPQSRGHLTPKVSGGASASI
jgi:hypothetical protein